MTRTALVVGCAACVWEDVAAAREFIGFDYDAVYCVKLAGVHWPEPFQVWATLHPEYMNDYETQRAANGFPAGYEIVAPLVNELGEHGKKGGINRRVSFRWPGMNSSASSGIYAAKVALDDGYDKVVLAGVPMDMSNHFSRGTPWAQRDSFSVGLNDALPYLRERVRSMSGRTKELLGAPTSEWLAAQHPGAMP